MILQNGETIVDANNKNIFNKYLAEIAKLRPLSREEEIVLFKRIQLNDDQKAIDMICKHNLLFVVMVAKRYAKTLNKSSLTLEDLVNDGNIGLLLAIRKFDYTTGNKFISYAVWMIKSCILKSIQDNVKSIRIPSNARSVINKSKKQEIKLEQIFGRTPSHLEIFEAMIEDGEMNENDTINKFDKLININFYEKSLNSLINDETVTEIGELIKSDDLEPQDLLLGKERKQLILKLIDNVPQHIKNYYNDYYGLDGEKPLSLIEMGDKYEEQPATIKLRMGKHLRNIKRKHNNMKKYFFSE